MDHNRRLRRVALLCIHFTRNLAFFRAMSDSRPDYKEGEFWITLKGNSLDVAVLEWCKLFGERDGKHSWQKICADQRQFKEDLVTELGITNDEWEQSWTELRSYRNAFVAHLDDELTMHIPNMSLPIRMVAFYYDYVMSLDEGSFFTGFPSDLYIYYDDCYQKAVEETEHNKSLEQSRHE